jgi:sugar phosphate isomerase/epimerase
MRRRTFLKSTATSLLGASLVRPALALPDGHPYVKTIGLQLWTVRNQLEQDVPGTIQAVADAGYKQVELMRVLDADKYLPAARDAGLGITSAFIDWESIGNPESGPSFDEILEKGKQIGLKYLVFGYIGKGYRETVEHFQRHAERANQAGEKCRKAGIQLCYHNHSFEFAKLSGERAGWDVLVQEFDHALVKFEVDIFWVAIGGRDPINTMRTLNGRVAQVHLKDLLKGSKMQHDEGKVSDDAFKELGNGVLDIAKTVTVAQEVGVDQCHVEQDQSTDPIDSIGQSLKHLQRI